MENLPLEAEDVTQLVECLSSVNPRVQSSATTNQVGHTCIPSTLKVQTGELGVYDHFWLHSKLEANLSHIKLCLKNKQ